MIWMGILMSALAAPPPPVINGQETSSWPAVGVLYACDGSNGCFNFCSGTLIAPQWVLTAAHCAEPAINPSEMGNFSKYFGIGPAMGDFTEVGTAAEFIIHPEYSYDDMGIYYDVALVRLSEPLLTAPIAVNQEPYAVEGAPSAWLGELLTYVGYGASLDDGSGGGIKRTVGIPMMGFFCEDGNFGEQCSGSAEPYSIITLDEIEPYSNVCYGDSGGAALRVTDSGTFLTGVNSFVSPYIFQDTACFGGIGGSANVYKSLEFIETHVELPEVNNPGEPSEPASEPDEPAGEPSTGTDTANPVEEGSASSVVDQELLSQQIKTQSLLGCAVVSGGSPRGHFFTALGLLLLLVVRRDRA